MSNKREICIRKLFPAIGLGLVVMMVMATAILLLETFLVLNGTIDQKATVIIAFICHAGSAYVGCILAGNKGKDLATISAVLVLVISILLHMILSLLVVNTGFGHIGRIILPETLGFGLAVLSLKGKKDKRKNRRAIKRYL